MSHCRSGLFLTTSCWHPFGPPFQCSCLVNPSLSIFGTSHPNSCLPLLGPLFSLSSSANFPCQSSTSSPGIYLTLTSPDLSHLFYFLWSIPSIPIATGNRAWQQEVLCYEIQCTICTLKQKVNLRRQVVKGSSSNRLQPLLRDPEKELIWFWWQQLALFLIYDFIVALCKERKHNPFLWTV